MQEVKGKFIRLLVVGIVLVGCIGGWLWESVQQYGINAEICKADYYVFISDPLLIFQTIFLIPVFLIALSQLLRDMGRVQVIIREKNRKSVWWRHMRIAICLAVGFTVCLVIFTSFFSLISGFPNFNWREVHSVYWDWCAQQVLKAKWVHLSNVIIAFVITEFVLLCTVGILFTFIHFLTSSLWLGWLCTEGLMLCRLSMLQTGKRGGIIQKLTIDWASWDDLHLWFSGIIMGIFVILCIVGMGLVYAKKKGFLNEK